MLHFGKKFRFGKIAVEEEETDELPEEASFAPAIFEEERSENEKSNVLPDMDFENEPAPEPKGGNNVDTGSLSGGKSFSSGIDHPKRTRIMPWEVALDEAQQEIPEEQEDDDTKDAEDAEEAKIVEETEETEESEETEAAEEDDETEEAEEAAAPEESAVSDPSESLPYTEENLQFLYESSEEEEEPQEEAPEEDLTDARPAELFLHLRSLPLCDQVYGLHGSRMLLSCPDEAGGVYLFEENGDYIIAEPSDCDAYVRILSVEGSFRNKEYKTKDLAYILREKTFPISAYVHTKAELELAERDGYLPYKQSASGKAIQMVKPMSLYRMKDTVLRVEFAGGKTVGESEEYVLDFDRSLFEESEGSKHFSRICKAAADTILRAGQPFFTLQVLKVRKNLVLAFPMDGKPLNGDRFADGRITELATTDDGTIVMRIGADDQVTLPLREGKPARGQHDLRIE